MKAVPLVALCASLLIACSDDDPNNAAGGSGGSTTSAGGGGSGGEAGGSGATGGGGSVGEPTAQLPPPDLGSWTGETPPDLQPSANPPADLAGVAATHYGALSCGPHPENVFDLLIPDGANGPLPIVIYIHGGGFTSGSRTTSYSGGQAQQTTAYLGRGLAYATLDYRFLDDNGVRTSLQDSQVCIQYIRYHAATLGIDPDKVVLAGGSGGAGTSLWLGTSPDQADASHPILAMSTRVSGVILDMTQATYDVLHWPTAVFAPEYEDLLVGAMDGGLFDDRLIGFYGVAAGVPSVVELLKTDPDYIAYREAIDMLAWMTSDDAPIWARTANADETPLDANTVNHHPFHVRALLDRGNEVGLEVIADAQALSETPSESRVEFAERVLGL